MCSNLYRYLKSSYQSVTTHLIGYLKIFLPFRQSLPQCCSFNKNAVDNSGDELKFKKKNGKKIYKNKTKLEWQTIYIIFGFFI